MQEAIQASAIRQNAHESITDCTVTITCILNTGWLLGVKKVNVHK